MCACVSNEGCSNGLQYCDSEVAPGEVPNRETQNCQATYRMMENGTLEPLILTCFNGIESEEITEGYCLLQELTNMLDVYFHCVCKGHLCNALVVIPSTTPATSSGIVCINYAG